MDLMASRVQCNYPGTTVAFHVDSGSNPNYFASLIEYENGDGSLASVDLKEALDSDSWLSMQQSWGADMVKSKDVFQNVLYSKSYTLVVLSVTSDPAHSL